jgi:hydrogenase-4 component E
MTNLFIVLFSFTLLLASLTGRLGKYVSILAFQGLLLFLIVLSNFDPQNLFTFLFLSVETLLVKTLLVPYVLNSVIRKNDSVREMSANISTFSSLFITSFFLVLGFVMSYMAKKISPNISTLYFGVAVSTIATSLFLILTRKKIITHVMGYLMLENGIFLASLSITSEMPFLVDIGILLDLFLAILLLSVFAHQISRNFEEFDIDELSNLKD